MSQYDSKKIEVLLAMSLSRANTSLDPKGFEILSDDIKTKLDIKEPKEPLITQRYINERIHQQIKKQQSGTRSEISLLEKYLDEMSDYLGFKRFTYFEEQYDKIQRHLKLKNDLDSSAITVLYDSANKGFVEDKCNEALYLKQKPPFKFSPIDSASLNPSELDKYIDSDKVSLFFFDPSKSSEDVTAVDAWVKKAASNNTLMIPVYTYLGDQDEYPLANQYSAWLTPDDAELLIQCILVSAFNSSSDDLDRASKGNTTVTNIEGSGTVNLGTIGSISADYISSRDMHIVINKDKSKEL